jgi:hypothetical protein
MDSLGKVNGLCLLLHRILYFVRQFGLWRVPLDRIPNYVFRKSAGILGTTAVLLCIRAQNIAFEKPKNDHALDLPQLQIPELTINYISRLRMPAYTFTEWLAFRNNTMLNAAYGQIRVLGVEQIWVTQSLKRCVWANTSSGHGTNLGNTIL